MGAGRGRVLYNVGGMGSGEISDEARAFMSNIESVNSRFYDLTPEQVMQFEQRLFELGIVTDPSIASELLNSLTENEIAYLRDYRSFKDLNSDLMDEDLSQFPALARMTGDKLYSVWMAANADSKAVDRGDVVYAAAVGVAGELIPLVNDALPGFDGISAIVAGNNADSRRMRTAKGFYAQFEAAINMNSNADFDNTSYFTTNHGAGFGVASTTIHEIGHGVMTYLKRNNRDVMTSFETSTNGMDAVSAYGNNNSNEMFAESFLTYVLGSPLTSNYHREFENLMSNVGLSSLQGSIR